MSYLTNGLEVFVAEAYKIATPQHKWVYGKNWYSTNHITNEEYRGRPKLAALTELSVPFSKPTTGFSVLNKEDNQNQ